jgi:hypothetical protein
MRPPGICWRFYPAWIEDSTVGNRSFLTAVPILCCLMGSENSPDPVNAASAARSDDALGTFRYFVRRVGRRVFRWIWHLLRRWGVRIPAAVLLRSPVDLKVGYHYLDADSDNRVLAVCDFACMPMSYDIVYFLTVADSFRRRKGVRWLDVVFLAHHNDPLADGVDALEPAAQGAYRRYVHNLGIQATQLFEAIGDVQFFTDRSSFTEYWSSAHRSHLLFPENYAPQSPNFLLDGVPIYGTRHLYIDTAPSDQVCSLRPPDNLIDLAQRWLARRVHGDNTIVTVTLRETPVRADWNSNIGEWQKLVDHFKGTNVSFVVIRDYSKVFDEAALTGDNVVECPEAVLDVAFRAAVYEVAALNLFVLNGPCSLCFFNPRCNYIVFNMPAAQSPDRARHLQYRDGFEPGKDFKLAGPFQKMVWKPDDFDVLQAETERLLSEIDRPARPTPPGN